MSKTEDGTKPSIRLLIGIKLFNTDRIGKNEKKAFKKYVEKIKSHSDDFEIIKKWAHKFLPDPLREISNKITRLIRLSSFILIISSFLIGITAASVLFYYDGSAPINVLSILTAFILLPIILLISSFLLPLFSSNDSGLLSPLFHLIESRIDSYLSNQGGKTSQFLSSELVEFNLVYSEPLLLYFKITLQKCAIFYVLGALLWMLVNVITTDLAFSWSSTLELESD
jgi:hypothetical protein